MIPRRNPRATRPRLSRHPLRLAAAGVAVALAAAACGGTSSGGGEVKEGGVFRLGSNSTIDSLNPFVAFESDAYTTFEYIYPELVQYNPGVDRAHSPAWTDLPLIADSSFWDGSKIPFESVHQAG
jgi:ABC-type transport system substrate-binding protein